MKIIMFLILGATVLAAGAKADDTGTGHVSARVDTISVMQLCSQYIGKDIDDLRLGSQPTISRVIDPNERARVGIPEHAPQSMLKVSLRDFPLDFKWDELGNLQNWYRDYDVYIDDEKMKLVKIVSTMEGWQDSVGRSLEEVAVLDSTMLNKTVNFAGYPDTVRTCLLDILRNCPFSPQLSSYLSARHIYESGRDIDSTRRVWVVCLIDMPPLRFSGPGADLIPIHERDFVQVVFDDDTGKPIRSGN